MLFVSNKAVEALLWRRENKHLGGKNFKCIVFFNVYHFIYFYIWIIFIFSNFLKMRQLKNMLYSCVDIEESFRLGRKVCWCVGIENFNQS